MVVEKKSLIFTLIIIITSILGIVINSILACRLSVLFLMVVCFIRARQENNFLNPYMLFLTVPFSLLIYADISRYTNELSVSTWVLAIINIAVFIVSIDFTPEYKHINKCVGVGSGKRLKSQAIIFTILSILPSIYRAALGGYMPLSYIFSILGVAGVTCAMKSKNIRTIMLVCVITVASWIIYVPKSSVLMFAIALLVSYEKYYIKTSKQKRKFMVLAALAIFVMILSFSFANQGRENGGGQAAVDYFTKYGDLVWNGNAALMMPYMYLTTPWYNLEYVVSTQDVRTMGLWLIKPFLGYLQLDSLFADFYTLTPYSTFNTFGFIAYNFKDFGYWGSCISTAILGVFVKKIYSRYKMSKSPLDIACYALVAQAVVEMFFSNHFFTQSYPFTIVIVMALYKMLFCKHNEIEVEEDYLE